MCLVNPTQSNPGDTIEASDVNDPVNQLAAVINGGIETVNIADNAVTTAKIADGNVTASKLDFGGSGSGIWWQEIGRKTLTVAGDTISVTGLPARKYLKIYFIALPSGVIDPYIRFNNDSASNYNFRYIVNYSSASGAVSQTAITLDPASTANDVFGEVSINDISAQEKLVTANIVGRGGAGAGTQATSIQVTGKWSNTVASISQVDIINNGGAGDFAIGSEVVVLGHN